MELVWMFNRSRAIIYMDREIRQQYLWRYENGANQFIAYFPHVRYTQMRTLARTHAVLLDIHKTLFLSTPRRSIFMCLFRPGRANHVKTKRISVSEPTNLQFNDQQRNLAIFSVLVFDRHAVGSVLSRWWHTRASAAIDETQKWPSISHISRPNFVSSGKKRPCLSAWLPLHKCALGHNDIGSITCCTLFSAIWCSCARHRTINHIDCNLGSGAEFDIHATLAELAFYVDCCWFCLTLFKIYSSHSNFS